MLHERHSLRRDGTELSYVMAGSGQVVVILHGLAGDSGEFGPTIEALSADFCVVALDQRGHGQSMRRPSDLSRDAYVEDAIALIEYVIPGHRVHLAGQSMGAHTAMLAAAKRPDLVDSLVLLESDAGSGNSEEASALGAYFASWPVPFEDEEAAKKYLGESAIGSAWVAAMERRNDGLWPRFDADIMESSIRRVMIPRWDEWLSVQARTLVIYADNEMFSEEQKTAFLAHRPETLRADLNNASHDAHLDQPGQWIDVLRRFLLADTADPLVSSVV